MPLFNVNNQEYDYYGLAFKLNEFTNKFCINELKKEMLEVIYAENVTPLLQAVVKKRISE